MVRIKKTDVNKFLKHKEVPLDKTADEYLQEIVDGEYDPEDLEEGLSIEDFEDPQYSESDNEPEDSLPDLLGQYFKYDDQNVAEILCQIRDCIDANSKCMLSLAQELRGLHHAYIHVNTPRTEDKTKN